MNQQNIEISKVYLLIHNYLVKDNLEYNKLKQSGYTLSQIYSLNSQYPTLINITNIYEYFGYSINEFYKSGFTAYQMKHANIDITGLIGLSPINPRTLYTSGYSILDLYNAGYSYLDFLNSGFTIDKLLSGGLTINQINNLGNLNLPLNDLIIRYNASIVNLTDEGYSLNEISPYCGSYYTIQQFINLGYTLKNLYDASFSPSSFYLGYINQGVPTISQLLSLGFDSAELIQLDINLINYYTANYSTLNLFNNGFYLLFLKKYYSIINFKNDNINTFIIYESNLFTIYDFSTAGYTLIEYYESNIPVLFIEPIFLLSQVINIGYNLNSIVSTHFYPASDFYNLGYPVSILTKYYSINELLLGGYSKKDLNIEGNKITKYCCSITGLKCLPTKLGSSFNNIRSSSKISYSQSIKNRIGGSYNSSYSSYSTGSTSQTITNQIPGQIPGQIPILCLNPSNSTTLSTNVPLCKTINIPSKTSTTLSYFIRNYINRQVILYNPNATSQDILNAINDITDIQETNSNMPIYTIIQNYFDPSTIILL
jgi:hypothetical protein